MKSRPQATSFKLRVTEEYLAYIDALKSELHFASRSAVVRRLCNALLFLDTDLESTLRIIQKDNNSSITISLSELAATPVQKSGTVLIGTMMFASDIEKMRQHFAFWHIDTPGQFALRAIQFFSSIAPADKKSMECREIQCFNSVGELQWKLPSLYML